MNPGDVKHYPDASLYDPSVLRTFFITFENPAWESELVTFNNTDVDVPATVVVDGITYSDVGIHFRGNSSFGVGEVNLMMVFHLKNWIQNYGRYWMN